MAQARHQDRLETSEENDDFVLIPHTLGSSQDALPEVFRLPVCNGHDLYEAPVDKLQHLYSSGALSCAEYVRFCLDRVQKVKA